MSRIIAVTNAALIRKPKVGGAIYPISVICKWFMAVINVTDLTYGYKEQLNWQLSCLLTRCTRVFPSITTACVKPTSPFFFRGGGGSETEQALGSETAEWDFLTVKIH